MKRRDGQRGRVPQEAPFDRVTALARWIAKLSTMTARGFSAPLFERLVFGPVVHVDLLGDDPPGELLEKTLVGIVRLTKQQLPS